MSKNEILNYLGLFFVLSLIFVSGFYFGYKSNLAGVAENVTATSEIRNLAQKVENESEQNVNIIDTEGVFWIKVGQPPKCPETHPIIGKFDSSINVYYLPEHKSYDKIKAHICFINEEIAREKSGFIRKY